jgi:hypothetical protein
MRKYSEFIYWLEILYRCRWREVHLLISARIKRLLISLTVYYEVNLPLSMVCLLEG